jgi:hypothetical protein
MAQVNSATFQQRQSQEDLAMFAVAEYLAAKDGTTYVMPATIEQQKNDDIDLVWARVVRGQEVERTVEVKVDSYVHKTGNFAFETVSNESKTTPGCFLRTKAYWFIYVCSTNMVAWIMPTQAVQDWFLRELATQPNRFRLFETSTKVNGSYYNTLGRLVPSIEVEQALVLGVNIHKVKL